MTPEEATARGARAVTGQEWTPQLALDVIRENRARNHAPFDEYLYQVGERLAVELVVDLDVAPADIVTVLLAASSRLGAFALSTNASSTAVVNVMGYAAYDIHQHTHPKEARGGVS